MSFDEALAARVRDLVADRGGITERRMFGGLAFMREGNMFCGLIGGDLMVRVGLDAYEQALRTPHVRPMDFTGRPLAGYVYVAPAGTQTTTALRRWLQRCLAYAETLPAKRAKARAGNQGK